MASLAGKTLFITGASRGIGLAIALRAARDGANIAIAAKTAVAASEAARHHPQRRGGNRSGRRQGAGAAVSTFATRTQVRAAVARGGRALRRHRHPGQQRQRDLA